MGLKHSYTALAANDASDEVSRTIWNADHVIAGTVEFPDTPAPGTPAAGNAAKFAVKMAEKMFAGVLGPKGLAQLLQPSLAFARTIIWNPFGNSASAPANFGATSMTATGTLTARNVAATNLFTRTRRLGVVSAATAGALAGIRTSAAQITTGDGAGLGGFFFTCRFGISDAAAVAGARMFVGMQASVAAPTNVEPSTLVNAIGVGHGAADTNLKLFYGGTTAQTPIDLGANFPTNTLSTELYELTLFAASTESGTVYYRVLRVNTGHVATGTLSGGAAVLPTSTVLLAPINSYRTNNATALAVGIDHGYFYLETEH